MFSFFDLFLECRVEEEGKRKAKDADRRSTESSNTQLGLIPLRNVPRKSSDVAKHVRDQFSRYLSADCFLPWPIMN